VGPAGLPHRKEIKHLPLDGTLGIPDVFPCVSQRKVSRSGAARWKDIEHSVYVGRERLGRYVQTDRTNYRAFDANDRQLGNFRVRARALAAIRKAQAKRK
jgi:predicted phage tail protein